MEATSASKITHPVLFLFWRPGPRHRDREDDAIFVGKSDLGTAPVQFTFPVSLLLWIFAGDWSARLPLYLGFFLLIDDTKIPGGLIRPPA